MFIFTLAKPSGDLLDELLDLERNPILYLPPFAALVLDRCSKPDDLPKALSDVRHEMSQLRDHGRGAFGSLQRSICRGPELPEGPCAPHGG